MMTFAQAQEYLYRARIFGIRPGLERIRELLRRLGNPQQDYQVVHIAGTNGKGSVSSFLSFIAAEAGYRTGWYTSPFLEHFNERMRVIDGRCGLEEMRGDFRAPEIPDQVFAAIMTEISEIIESMLRDGFEMPTVFEMETAAALLWFSRRGCELVVLEVGLGGRLDSTNVVARPLVTVITALGYDHMDRLGGSLAEIAFEKAGIIKENCPLVLYHPREACEDAEDAEAALQKICATAREKHAPMTLLRSDEISDIRENESGQSFQMRHKSGSWKICLLGRHQIMNAALALKAAEFFADDDAIRRGLAGAVWPGRLERLRREPPVLIDGAHNRQGCAMLRRECERRFQGQKLVVLCGMLEDKEHREMLRLLLEGTRYGVARLIVTMPPDQRAMDARQLALEAAEILALDEADVLPLNGRDAESKLAIGLGKGYNNCEIRYEREPARAVKYALAKAAEESLPLLCFGSLYLIGQIRPLLREEIAAEKKADSGISVK